MIVFLCVRACVVARFFITSVERALSGTKGAARTQGPKTQSKPQYTIHIYRINGTLQQPQHTPAQLFSFSAQYLPWRSGGAEHSPLFKPTDRVSITHARARPKIHALLTIHLLALALALALGWAKYAVCRLCRPSTTCGTHARIHTHGPRQSQDGGNNRVVVFARGDWKGGDLAISTQTHTKRTPNRAQ